MNGNCINVSIFAVRAQAKGTLNDTGGVLTVSGGQENFSVCILS